MCDHDGFPDEQCGPSCRCPCMDCLMGGSDDDE
jgi:hypothetical protein